jgi:hypothetical protein
VLQPNSPAFEGIVSVVTPTVDIDQILPVPHKEMIAQVVFVIASPTLDTDDPTKRVRRTPEQTGDLETKRPRSFWQRTQLRIQVPIPLVTIRDVQSKDLDQEKTRSSGSRNEKDPPQVKRGNDTGRVRRTVHVQRKVLFSL